MEIFSKLGFDLKLFLGQIINFLILVFLFKKFLYGPILRILKEREDKIRKGIEDSEKANANLENSRKDSAEILKNARIEAQAVIDNVKKAADDMKREIIEKSKADYDRIVNEAREQAGAEIKKMEKNIKVMSIDLSEKILSNVIQKVFSEEERKKILQKAVEKIEVESRQIQ